MNTTATENVANGVYATWARLFESSIKSAAKIQEESTRWLVGLLDNAAEPQQWQRRTQAVMQQTMSVAQKNLEEASRLMMQNANAGLEMMERLCHATPNMEEGDVQSRNQDMYESVLATLRENVRGVVQANSRMVESWAEAAKTLTSSPAESAA